MRAAVIGIVLAGVTAASVAAVARAEPQRFGGGREADQGPSIEYQGNTPYDGRFVFVRLRYEFGGFGRSRGGPPWSHDYPRGEVHFGKILQEISYVRARTDGSNVLSLDDPELFNYPIAYMAEPGFWTPTDKQAEHFRAYLKKGGFAIFDDFREQEGAWINLQDQMRRVLPEARWIDIGDGSQQVWHSFFEIKNPTSLEPHPVYAGRGLHPSYWGLFEDNNPSKRLIVIANVDGDISEYWEFAGEGFVPVALDNEAFKYGVNYFMYGILH
jgi:Domain of unknown function (DUF4159)